VNILDTPFSNLLCYLPRVIGFVKKALKSARGTVFIHCVHGQSRSCAVCIAYLIDRDLSYKISCKPMHMVLGDCEKSNIDADGQVLHTYYRQVASARPCMAVNPGFVKQLEIFRQMKSIQVQVQKRNNTPVLSKAHAIFRCYRASAEFHEMGTISKTFPLLMDHAKKFFVCKKCNSCLFSDRNVLEDWSEEELDALPKSDYWISSAGGKKYLGMEGSTSSIPNLAFQNALNSRNVLKVEPIDWMLRIMRGICTHIQSRGILLCPKCDQKIGYWDWCLGRAEPTSSIIVSKSRIECRLNC